ncbi:MAG TPA: 3'-5' exonuclease, partial [Miltoncostaeaceae bacterium]|nr:3'-5' exonuclease [Miltoncostaeaceae bacterium]
YEDRKRRAGALDFEDLELAARSVLRKGLGPRLRRVYVDEFQDANPLQDELVTLLAADRTVVVGDAAQAIYGFRHADPTRFLERVRGDAAASLRDNHRSDPRLLDALNGWLEIVLGDQPGFARLEAAATGTGPPVAAEPAELVRVTPPPGEPRAKREAEAVVVAGEVAALLDRGYEPRDIAVLFRAITEVEPYRAALAARGIRYHVVAGSGFLAHDQVADAVALLRVVENPHDEPALVRVLASPYVAASDEALVGMRAAVGRGAPLWPAARPAVGGLVEGLRALRRSSGLAGLVDRVVGACGYDLAVLGLEDGARRFANLRKLVRMAASFEAVRGPDLRSFLRMLEELEERRQDPGEAVLVDPSLDAVRLATVHGVKGQEFPAVVIADASHGIPGITPIVLVAPDGRAGIRAQRRDGAAIATPAYAELQTELSRAAEAEERRLAYVALTRAARHAAVVGRHRERGSMMAILDTPLAGIDEGVVRLGEGLVRVRTVTAAEPVPAAAARVGLREMTPAPPPTVAPPPAVDRLAGRSLSFSALEAARACGLRLHLTVELGLEPGPALAAPLAADGWPAHALGSIVHACLERHRFGDPAPEPGWAAAAARELGLRDSPDDADRAEAIVAALLASPLAARISAGTAVAERPFAVVLDGVLVRGVIDLHVVEADGRALLVDWKTHRLDGRPPAGEMAAYRSQQAIYGLAALRAGADAVELSWVFLEALDDPQVRTVGPADVPALEAEVRAVLDALRASEPVPAAVTAQPFCAGCPGLRALCPVALVAETGRSG